MVPVFPLGVKKDEPPPSWGEWPKPVYDAESVCRAVEGHEEPAPRFAQGFPSARFGPEIGVKLAGAGGDGAQTAALLVARSAINEGFDATYIPSYGPESRGGTSYADVRLAEAEVLSPAVPAPHVLVAFNAPSLVKFGPSVARGGVVVYDRSVIAEPPTLDPSVRVVGVPCSEIAAELGTLLVKNIVAVGALQAATRFFPDDTYEAAIAEALHGKDSLVALNRSAFARGRAAAEA
jgi:2-oxoisovalerate ferredoxin oxidoreductase beta subunit